MRTRKSEKAIISRYDNLNLLQINYTICTYYFKNHIKIKGTYPNIKSISIKLLLHLHKIKKEILKMLVPLVYHDRIVEFVHLIIKVKILVYLFI